MNSGHVLERVSLRCKSVGPTTGRCFKRSRVRAMTNRAVVVIDSRLRHVRKRNEALRAAQQARSIRERSDDILMFVVRESYSELPHLDGTAKREATVVSWRCFCMTVRADWRLRAFEKLRAMAAYTSIVSWIVSNIRIAARLYPIRAGRFVASTTSLLVLLRCMREL